MGAYVTAATSIPTIQYGILTPIIIGGWLIWRSPRLTWIIDAVPQSWLVGVQLYRALGMIFLILYATGLLPACSPGRPASATCSWTFWARRRARLCALAAPER
jgi:hypothetical protein